MRANEGNLLCRLLLVGWLVLLPFSSRVWSSSFKLHTSCRMITDKKNSFASSLFSVSGDKKQTICIVCYNELDILPHGSFPVLFLYLIIGMLLRCIWL